ncbi:glutamate-5-semialdehyde dehydrogenase [Aquibacillus sp. 3ASR75-11]|uniref:Gamma-glutamyl phosphate reductase n=1 Tax=Terrihalobacillus insolitus TaxID=2950438 RepID=A0A9X3WTT4_9BACI|nr:glutamate-5-semialdehyde dehydrogenase [Terrihalobacillus insolitus]MDC3414209.1 glutamate-5-semialdehyde dehydrogenase [Terrihalobacillus insolitus]MDC3425415.1 glutamate-5-semialdehyde dehydrogenase [Terrihalobacillus insolitus]
MSELVEKAQRASELATRLAVCTTEQKNDALKLIAAQLLEETAFILTENKKDLAAGRANGIGDHLLDRLRLTEERMKDMAEGLHQVADLPDPVGEILEGWERPNGLQIEKIRVPLGVIGMIYEARPNVTVDASSLCLKTGNTSLLRGSSSALHSNKAIIDVIHRALEISELPTDSVQLLEDTSRETVTKMLQLNECLDVIIPRGGAELIKTVVKNATVPVLETGVGNCHIYIDDHADHKMAVEIAVNAKTQRPSVCNSTETILIHKDWANKHFGALVQALKEKNVEIRANEKARQLDHSLLPASKEDWKTEYLDLIVAIRVVDRLEEAINHIQTYGSKHSEAIITENEENVAAFFKQVDAAALYHNASTRFTDGFEFGFGAEIGISTQKLHARGPMGLPALTSMKYIIRGTGQIK